MRHMALNIINERGVAMSLSEQERKVLEELERSLYADDADLAKRFKKAADQTPVRVQQRRAARLVSGSFVALGGLSVILVGAITHLTVIGVFGFAMTLGGVVLASSTAKKTAVAAGAPVGFGAKQASEKPKSAPRSKLSLGEFFEERWNKRMNGDS